MAENEARRAANTAEMKFRLPNELHALIEAAASTNKRNASEEVRRRLETSFEGAPPTTGDGKTSDLLATIAALAADILEIYGKPWHEDPWARDVLASAIDVLIKARARRGEAKFEPAPDAIAELAWGESQRDPATAGQILAMSKLTGRSKL